MMLGACVNSGTWKMVQEPVIMSLLTLTKMCTSLRCFIGGEGVCRKIGFKNSTLQPRRIWDGNDYTPGSAEKRLSQDTKPHLAQPCMLVQAHCLSPQLYSRFCRLLARKTIDSLVIACVLRSRSSLF